MKYLARKKEYAEVKTYDKVLLLVDLPGVSAGTRGTVSRIWNFDESFTVEWDNPDEYRRPRDKREDRFVATNLSILAFEGELTI